MKNEKLCHRQAEVESCNVIDETKRDTGEWKKYGDLNVRVTYGKEDLTELLVSYAIGLASLKY